MSVFSRFHVDRPPPVHGSLMMRALGPQAASHLQAGPPRMDRQVAVGAASALAVGAATFAALRAKVRSVARTTLFLDCDDCLYSNEWAVANRITKSIERYCMEKMKLPKGKPYELYKAHGTCLRGLEKESIPHDRDEFLKEVHAVELDDVILPDAALVAMLRRLKAPRRTWVFTASVATHAERCLACLGITAAGVLPNRPLIDVRAVGFKTKYEEEAYRAAERIAGAAGPEECVLVDDSWSNMRAAKAAGWTTVLCGRTARDGRDASACQHADYVIGSIHELPTVLPELFH